MMAFLNGIGFGMILAVLIGPVFFSLLQTSLHKGVKAGTLMAAGVVISDAFYIFICYMGLSQLFENAKFQDWLGLIGGCIMLVFGIAALLKKVKAQPAVEARLVSLNKGEFHYLAKGFVLNFINPFAIAIWISAVQLGVSQYALPNSLWFFTGILTTVFLTDFAKVMIACRLQNILTQGMLLWMNRVAGIGLILFGLRLIFFAMEK
jgi:threonine/homoserine/homoserine lactone efflux protein